MSNVTQLLSEYRGLVFAGVMVALWAGLRSALAYSTVREAILGIMLRAEKSARKGEFGVVNGEQIMSIVVAQVMVVVVPRLPMWMRGLFTEERVRVMALSLYKLAIDYLDNGKFDNSVIEETTPEPKTE